MSKKDNKLTSPQRERVSINFVGVDNSSPDISVKDGAMAEMYNVRYNDDAWRPVHMFNKVCDIRDDYTVVYHHPAAGENVYIVSDDSVNYYSYDSKTGVATLFASPEDFVKDIKHFGNVLIFIGQDNSVEYYVLQDGKYYRFEKPTAPKVTEYDDVLNSNPQFALPNYWANDRGLDMEIYPDIDGTNRGKYGVWALYDEGGNSIFPIGKDDMWRGEIALFSAYRLSDGSIISPSSIGIISSEKVVDAIYRIANSTMEWREMTYDGNKYYGVVLGSRDVTANPTTFMMPQMRYFAPSIGVSIPDNLPSNVESVAIFSTRIFSPFEKQFERRELLLPNVRINDALYTFTDNKLPEQTFYLLKDIPLREFSLGKKQVTLTYELLKDVELNARYSPNNNIHDVSFGASIDYNERFHIGDITTHLAKPNNILDTVNVGSDSEALNVKCQATLELEKKLYKSSVATSVIYDHTALNLISPFRNVITYHDYRCKAVSISVDNGSGATTKEMTMLPATSNNVAYWVQQNVYTTLGYDTLHYPQLSFMPFSRQSFTQTIPQWEVNDSIVATNKVMVSQTNNPFAFDFANTYSFGSADNKVLAVQSAAVEMSDAKFGEFPLYVFTESGIFGLQSGAESVYSNVVPINYDRIINPRTLAINYNIVYITKKGIHLLNSEGSTLISQPIDTMLGYPDIDKFQWLYPLRSTQYNEIAFVVDGIAYVYSLINGVWSTRSFDMEPISQEEAYRNNEVFNIINENTALPDSCVIASRPIKLGSVEYKRLETFIPRFASLAETENMTITITIEGSNDCKEWKELRKVDAQGYTVIRRTPQSCKYFRFILEFIDVDEFTFSNVDLEYYVKFLRRMR